MSEGERGGCLLLQPLDCCHVDGQGAEGGGEGGVGGEVAAAAGDLQAEGNEGGRRGGGEEGRRGGGGEGGRRGGGEEGGEWGDMHFVGWTQDKDSADACDARYLEAEVFARGLRRQARTVCDDWAPCVPSNTARVGVA
jgi:hypothetical protein